MPPQRLRLEAEMKDNASPAVRKLREELSNLQAASADTRGVAKLNAEIAKLSSEATADASPAVRKLRTELAELQKKTAENRAIQGLTKEIGALKKMSGEVQATAGMKAFGSWFGEAKTAASGVMGTVGGLPSVLGAIGIGGIAAGASVAGLAAEMKRLGDSALDMKELSREAGISLDFVNRWSHAGEHFAVGTDAMKGALDGFASQLPDFDRGIGGLFKEFSLWPDLVRKMRSESPADALMDALRQAEEVGRTKGPQVQKQILDSIFPGHGADMEKLFRDGGLKGLLDQLQKPWAGPSPEYLQAAQKLRDSTIDFNNALQKFENTTGPKFLDMMTRIVDEAARFFDPDRSAIAKKQREGGAAGERHDLTPEQRKKIDDALGTPLPPGLKPGRADDGPLDDRHPLRRLSRGAYLKPSSYDGAGFGNLLQNASFTTGGTGSGTMEGAIAEGSKSGVLAALREMQIEQGLKGGSAFGASGGGSSGPDGDGGAAGGSIGGGGHGAGRRGHRGAGGGADEDLSDSGVAKFHSGKLFGQKAPQVMARLEHDLGLNETEAAAVLGNLGHESAGFKAFAEGGNGPGRGWAQWTDPGRKRRFFEYAQKNHFDPKSDEANYGFLRWELTHTHKGAIEALKSARTPEQKMMAFERSFEGAGVKAYGSRMRYMREALAAANAHPQADDPEVAGAPSSPRRADSLSGTPHRRADTDLSRSPQGHDRSSQHALTVDIRDPGGHVKSTHLQSRGPMRVEMRNRWRTGPSPLVSA